MTSKRHHYVPETLMKPWSQSKGEVRGYYWDRWDDGLRYSQKGPKGFCCQNHLLTLTTLNDSSDKIEREIFGPVDTEGAAARDKLIQGGPSALSGVERSNFIRLLLSLDARRPEVVKQLRAGGEYLRERLDTDPEVIAEAAAFGLDEPPSAFMERIRGIPFEDRALALIAKLTDSSRVGERVARAHWVVRRLSRSAPEVVLSDRPLVRVGGTFSNDFIWALPLAPDVIFFATPAASFAEKIRKASERLIVHEVNAASVSQADIYVFSTEDHTEGGWIEKRLRARSASVGSSGTDKARAPT